MAPKAKSARTVKKLTGGKRNKWKKGQSSSSNPDTFKHRKNIKVGVGFLGQPEKRSMGQSLATELRKLEDEDMSDGPDQLSDPWSEDAESQASTAKTWASNFTNCTNASFDKVLLFANGDSAMRKEILAVLAAVTDVIKAQGGKETETEYFAALLTVIETLVPATTPKEGEGVDEAPMQTLSAATYLLSLVLRRVGEGVLRKKFSESTSILTKLLANLAAHDPPTSLLKSTIRSLARILRVQEMAVWKESYTQQVFNSLVTYTTSLKPKVRHAAQNAVCLVLRGSSIMLAANPPTFHPAAVDVAKFCTLEIEESGGNPNSVTTLHVYQFLKDILPLLPPPTFKKVVEVVLSVVDPEKGTLLMVRAFDVLCHVLARHPPGFTKELIAQITAVFFDFLPRIRVDVPRNAWLTVTTQALVSLWKEDPLLTLSFIPKYMAATLTLLLENPRLPKQIKTQTKRIFDCLATIESPLKESLMEKTRAEPVALSYANSRSVLHRIFATAESCLNFQYHSVWDTSIGLIGELIYSLGDFFAFPSSPVFNCLQSMADLRETPSFDHKPALDAAIGRAVARCGPEFVLSGIPLMITGADDDRLDFPRSWLLPVLRDHVENTELGFFIKYFLPLSSKLFNRAVAKTKAGQVAEAKTYELLQYQIWCLLPGFCTRATDVPTSFKVVAKTFGILLQERSDIRNELMTSLRNLATKAVDDASVAEVKRFSKNYLPILFNLYTSEGEIGSSPLAVLETIRVFVSLADAEVIHSFVEKLFPKLEEEGIAVERRIKLLDIAVAMTPHMNEESTAKTLALVGKHLKVDDKSVQKKCYRILEEMCQKSDSQFVQSKLDEVSKMLVSSLSLAGASSKAPRLRSLTQLVGSFQEPRIEFVRKLIPEAVVCCNAASSGKTKIAACLFLSKATEKLVSWHADEKPKSRVVGELLELLSAGFAGTTDSIAAATSAITHLLKEHWGVVEAEMKSKIFQMSLVLLKSGKKPILKHVLGLAKFLLKKSHIRDFASNVRELTTVLGEFAETEKKAFRKVIRIILSISLKTLGFEVLHKMVPECFVKVVQNIHKTQQKKAAAAAKKNDADGSDNEDDDEDDDEGKPRGGGESFEDLLGDDSDVEEDDKEEKKPKLGKRSKREAESWLQENAGEEEIVDLLDPAAASKVLSSKPRHEDKKKGIQHEFKMAPDGRFVVTNGEEEEEGKKSKKDEVKLEMNELMDALEGAQGVGKKRKIKWKDEDDSDEEVEGPKKYKAGGRGIHRPLGGEEEREKEVKKSSAGFGAEYRSKKAKGDMKRKGKPDPYAYIPLDAKSLNKRKAKKLQGKFKNVVGAAKKGALKGKKLKVKRNKPK